jgi:hypothetical protein
MIDAVQFKIVIQAIPFDVDGIENSYFTSQRDEIAF